MMVIREAVLLIMTGATVGGVLHALFDVTFDPLAVVGGPNVELLLCLGAAAVCLLIGCIAGSGVLVGELRTDPIVLLTSP